VLLVGMLGHVIGLVLGARARRVPIDERPSAPSAARSRQLPPPSSHLDSRRGPTVTVERHAASAARGALSPWPLTAAVATTAVLLVEFGAVGSPAAPIVAVGFLLVFPGMALVRLLAIDDFATELSLSIATSIALATIVSTTSLYVGHTSTAAVLGVLVAITLVGMMVELLRTPSVPSRRESRRAERVRLYLNPLKPPKIPDRDRHPESEPAGQSFRPLRHAVRQFTARRPALGAAVGLRRTLAMINLTIANGFFAHRLKPPKIHDRDRHPEGERRGRSFRPLGQAVRRFTARRPAVDASEGLLRTLAATNLTIAVGLFVLLVLRGLV
jgi:hypothetical protein